MKRFLALMLCLATLLTLTACKKKQEQDTTTTTTTTEQEEQVDPTYAIDPVINRFFTEFIATYGGQALNSQSIRRGAGTANTKPEDLTKEYVAVINGLNITVRNASVETTNDGEVSTVYQLRVIIEGGTTTQSRDSMLAIFSMIARVTDPDCTLTMADDAVYYLENLTSSMQADYVVSNAVRVKSYIPIVEEMKIPCKIDMMVLNYAPIEE